MFLKSLSGRFLILTIVFVMLAEIFIFVPSIARFREDYLLNRLERAQIASLVRETGPTIDPELEEELLQNAGVFNVVLRRDEIRELMLSSPIPNPISATFDLRSPSAMTLITDAMARLTNPDDEIIRVVGHPVQDAGLMIDITLPTAPMRDAMIDYGLRILILSAVISIFTASLLFISVQFFLVRPIKGVVDAMNSYAAAPEDARRIIEPSASVTELHEAETSLKALQTELSGALRQKAHLAQLGEAVAKVSHDLRNILTAAQLFTDRIETSEDPTVRRLVPKLVGSISRAVNLCESTLAFGRAEEPAPALAHVSLNGIVSEVVEAETLARGEYDLSISDEVPVGFMLRADSEQLYRVISNLVRNARQAITATGQPGEIRISANETEEDWQIVISDTGPGLPPRAKEHLFTPFQGGSRKGGSGLGLAISSELVKGHGGRIALRKSAPGETVFAICLPKGISIGTELESAAIETTS